MNLSPSEIMEIAGDDNRMRHVLFARYGLGWDLLTTLHVRESFGDVPLDESKMTRMLAAHLAKETP